MYTHDLSIIIVAYKSREDIGRCLDAIFSSITKYSFEVIVIDNSNNVDGTVDFLNSKFGTRYSNIRIIANANEGFGKANNRGLTISKARDILVLNPDTEVRADTLQIMLDFLRSRPDVGIATCKLLDGEGRLEKSCRRSFPDPWVSLARLSGLSIIFPKNKWLGRYNMSFADENQEMEIDACSGSFMLMRRELIDKLGFLFDPDYFMYGEDLDTCYKAQKLGLKVWYYPKTTTNHFKGTKSAAFTKKEPLLTLWAFHNAMWIFYKKNISQKYPFFFHWLVWAGIWGRYWLKRLLMQLNG